MQRDEVINPEFQHHIVMDNVVPPCVDLIKAFPRKKRVLVVGKIHKTSENIVQVTAQIAILHLHITQAALHSPSQASFD